MDSRPLIAAALLVHDKEFIHAHHRRVDPQDFPDGPLRDLVRISLHCFEQHGTALTATVLQTYLDDINDEDEAADLYELYERLQQVVDEESLPALRHTAEDWLNNRFVARAIEEAREAIRRGDREAALAALARAERGEKQEETRVELATALGTLTAIRREDEAVPTGIDVIDQTLEGGMRPGELGIVLAATNVGKALAVDTPVATPQGWKTIGELRPGDQVFDELGRPCTVLFVSPVWKKRPAYAVSFSSGETIIADEAHEWLVHSLNWKSPRIVETRELYRMKQRGERLYIESHAPLQLPEAQRNHIRDVQPAAPTDTVCITVDSPSHLFLAGRHMIPTHNSMFLSYLAAHALLAGKLVLYYSSELTYEQVSVRAAAAIFKKPMKEIQEQPDQYRQALEQVASEVGGRLFIDEMPTTIRGILADIREIERAVRRPEVIILDTPDDLKPINHYPTLYLALSEIYTDLRSKLANGLNLVVWASSQTNREAVDKARMSLRYIGDSFAKAQRAHIVLGLVQTEQEQRAPFAPSMRIVLLKDTLHGRKGAEWRFNVTFGREDTPGYPGFILDEEP